MAYDNNIMDLVGIKSNKSILNLGIKKRKLFALIS